MFSGSQNCLRNQANIVVPATSIDLCHSSPTRLCWPNVRQLRAHKSPAPTTLASQLTFLHRNSSFRAISGTLTAEKDIQAYHASRLPYRELPETKPISTNDGHTIQTEQRLSASTLDTNTAQRDTVGIVPTSDRQLQRRYISGPGSPGRPTSREITGRDAKSIARRQLRWGNVLDMLVTAIPQFKEPRGEGLWISKRVLVTLSGTATSNGWVHQVRGGCEVQVTDERASSDDARLVLLRGSTQAVALTKEYFLLLAKDFTRQPHAIIGLPDAVDNSHTQQLCSLKHDKLDQGLCSKLPACPMRSRSRVDSEVRSRSSGFASTICLPIRPVLSACKSHLAYDNELLKSGGTLVATATDVASFLRIVENLTTLKIPRLVKREVFGKHNERFNSVAARALLRMFTDSDIARFASTAALNRALAFLSKHSELSHEIRLLYTQCRLLRLTLEPQTYSHVLYAALAHDDLGIFREVLADLLVDGYRPNSMVWLGLMKYESSFAKKLSVASWMQRKRLVSDRSVKSQVVAELLRSEPNILRDNTQVPNHFVAAMDARFGRDWMSPISVLQALRTCRAVKAWDLALLIIQEAQERNVLLNANAMATILALLQERGSVLDCLHFLRSRQVQTVGRNNQQLIPIVFMAAWQQRFYNVCRVLWHYAASCGVITYKMQNVVTESLLGNQDRHKTSVSHRSDINSVLHWLQRAGKVIVGVRPDIPDRDIFPRLSRSPQGFSSTNSMAWLAQYVPNDGRRAEQRSLAFEMLKRDLEAWKYHAAPSFERLSQVLTAAYAKDTQWKNERIGDDGGTQPVQWMIENATSLHLVKREISLNTKSSYASGIPTQLRTSGRSLSRYENKGGEIPRRFGS